MDKVTYAQAFVGLTDARVYELLVDIANPQRTIEATFHIEWNDYGPILWAQVQHDPTSADTTRLAVMSELRRIARSHGLEPREIG